MEKVDPKVLDSWVRNRPNYSNTPFFFVYKLLQFYVFYCSRDMTLYYTVSWSCFSQSCFRFLVLIQFSLFIIFCQSFLLFYHIMGFCFLCISLPLIHLLNRCSVWHILTYTISLKSKGLVLISEHCFIKWKK